jgi:nucleoid-associated protein YgaU
VAEPPLRLTRRGRGVLIAFTASVLLVLFWLTAGPGALAGGQGDAQPADGRPPRTVVVGPGETLWDIAHRNDPDGDPRVTVHRISDLNGLSGPIVHPGQELRVPVR